MIEITFSEFALRAVDAGPRDGKPVVFLHAFPLTHATWQPQIDALSKKYRVIAPDSRGLGASSAGKFPMTVDHLADDLFAWLDYLETGPVVAVGLSMGGYVLQRAVAREPERFSSVVMCDTRCEADDNAGKLTRSNTISKIAAEGLQDFSKTFARKLLSPSAPDSFPEMVAQLETLVQSAKPEVVCNLLMSLASRLDSEESLRAWKTKAFLVCGAEDQISLPPMVRKMAECISNSEYIEIPRAGHLSNLENPEAFNAAIERALLG